MLRAASVDSTFRWALHRRARDTARIRLCIGMKTTLASWSQGALRRYAAIFMANALKLCHSLFSDSSFCVISKHGCGGFVPTTRNRRCAALWIRGVSGSAADSVDSGSQRSQITFSPARCARFVETSDPPRASRSETYQVDPAGRSAAANNHPRSDAVRRSATCPHRRARFSDHA